MASSEKALNSVTRSRDDRIAVDRRRHQHMGHQCIEKLVEFPEACAQCRTAMALAGAVVSKPMAEEHDLFVGVLIRSDFRVASSGEYTTRTSPPASAFTPNRSSGRLPGTRSMSPNEQKITFVATAAMSSALVDHLQRCHTHWAARVRGSNSTVPSGSSLVEAVADDGMSLSTTDFHDCPWLRDDPGDFVGQLACGFAVTKLSQVFHVSPAVEPSRFPPARASNSVSRNSSSSSSSRPSSANVRNVC